MNKKNKIEGADLMYNMTRTKVGIRLVSCFSGNLPAFYGAALCGYRKRMVWVILGNVFYRMLLRIKEYRIKLLRKFL